MKNKCWMVEELVMTAHGMQGVDGTRKPYETRKEAERAYKAMGSVTGNRCVQLYAEFYNEAGRPYDFKVLQQKSGAEYKKIAREQNICL